MKKLTILILALWVCLFAQATDFAYLTFETTTGEKVSVSIDNLSIRIDGTTLVTPERSFSLPQLHAMYFSATDETATDLQSLADEPIDWEHAEVYDLQGRQVPFAQLSKGVYIVKTDSVTYKIGVR